MKNKNKKMNSLLFSFALAVAFFSAVSAKAATTYYVDGANGNDNNGGTSTTSALKTIGKCLGKVVAGDTCSVMAGTYVEPLVLGASGTSTAPITIKNYNGAAVTINSGNSKAVRTNGRKDYYTFDGLRFISNHVVYSTNDWTLDFSDGVWAGNADPTAGNNGIIIRNCYIEGAIYFYGHNNRVENTEVNGKGLWGNGIQDAYAASHENSYVKNKIHDFTHRGIWSMQKTQNVVAENNIVYNTIDYGIDFDAAGALPDVNCVARGNEVYGFSSVGIGLENPSSCIVENNIIHDWSGNSDGMGIEIINYGPSASAPEYRNANTNSVVRNNLIYNAGRSGVEVVASPSNKIYNNTIFNTKATGGYYAAIALTGDGSTYYSINNEIKNNIISGPSYAIWIKTATADQLTTNILSNNVYYRPGQTNTHYWQSTNTTGVAYSLNSFKSAYANEESGSLIANPLFMSSSNADFHLQQNSPAIDKGVSLTSFNVDISGTTRPQGAAWDLGAYEYKSTASQTCTSFTYSNWGICSNKTQIRSILTSSPQGCSGGSPTLSQSCAYSNSDFSTLVANWKKISTASDMNNDGLADIRDLGIMMMNWQ